MTHGWLTKQKNHSNKKKQLQKYKVGYAQSVATSMLLANALHMENNA